MSLSTLTSCNALPAFAVYETISASSSSSSKHHVTICTEQTNLIRSMALSDNFIEDTNVNAGQVVLPRRKRRTRKRIGKNKEEAENQRMTHIAIEGNRRRLMNERLAVLRSIMPESYIQRVDQASVVEGAIDYVKELEQHLQYLEVQKRTLQQQKKAKANNDISLYNTTTTTTTTTHSESSTSINKSNLKPETPSFSKFFSNPQYTWYHTHDYSPSTQDCLSLVPVGDIEVKFIETHVNVRILTSKRPRQLLRIVARLQALRVSILHLNVTAMDAVVLYCMNLKVEEGCDLSTADNIAAEVHHLLTLLEAEVNKSTLV